jgi:hypothetical protein
MPCKKTLKEVKKMVLTAYDYKENIFLLSEVINEQTNTDELLNENQNFFPIEEDFKELANSKYNLTSVEILSLLIPSYIKTITNQNLDEKMQQYMKRTKNTVISKLVSREIISYLPLLSEMQNPLKMNKIDKKLWKDLKEEKRKEVKTVKAYYKKIFKKFIEKLTSEEDFETAYNMLKDFEFLNETERKVLSKVIYRLPEILSWELSIPIVERELEENNFQQEEEIIRKRKPHIYDVRNTIEYYISLFTENYKKVMNANETTETRKQAEKEAKTVREKLLKIANIYPNAYELFLYKGDKTTETYIKRRISTELISFALEIEPQLKDYIERKNKLFLKFKNLNKILEIIETSENIIENDMKKIMKTYMNSYNLQTNF